MRFPKREQAGKSFHWHLVVCHRGRVWMKLMSGIIKELGPRERQGLWECIMAMERMEKGRRVA